MKCAGLFICLLVFVNFASSDQTSDLPNDQLERLIEDKHLRKDGYTAFALATIHEKFPLGTASRHRVSQKYLKRRRRSAKTEAADTRLELELVIFNETLDLSVKFNPRLLEEESAVFVRNNNTLSVWQGKAPDCYLEGRTSKRGVVSLSYCYGLAGSVIEGQTVYRIDPVGLLEDDFEETVLVSKGSVPLPLDLPIDNPLPSLYKDSRWLPVQNETFGRRKRGTIPSTTFTIEVSLYLDEVFWAVLENDYNALTTDQKINMVALKWNGVQALFDYMQVDLGYTVTLKIKSIEFWQTNPDWFAFSATSLGSTLDSFCQGTKARTDILPADVHFLHTGSVANRGLAFLPGQCTSTNCGISTDTGFYTYYLPAHELGHTLGMQHDDSSGCFRPDSGIMESNGLYNDLWSTCNKADIDTFLASADSACLFREDVSAALVEAAVDSIQLPPGEWPGMLLSLDEYCEQVAGSGWAYRDWYYSVDVCTYHSCVNLNPGTHYGTMVVRTIKPSGTYCADGSICSGATCATLTNKRFDPATLEFVNGAWSAWGAVSTCSRSCGTGITLRKRSCTNPKPHLMGPCEGSEYDATPCNTEPCVDDSSDTATLIKSRAGETCSGFVANGVLSSVEYDGTGKARGATDVAQCEVLCNPQSGFTPSNLASTRYGLMPDGTPCTVSTASNNDKQGYPRGTGEYGLCIEGKCETFGCDNSTSGNVRDLCGMCGGENTTCVPVDGVYTSALTQGEHVEFARLPAGTSLILFQFTWNQMKENYVELFDTNGVALFSTPIQYIYDTRDSPVTIAGASWYFLWYRQFLYTFDTLTQDIIVKFYNKDGNPNVGIQYGYSLPQGSTNPPTQSPPSTVSTPTTPAASSSSQPATTSSASTDSGITPPGSTSTATCGAGNVRCGNGRCIWYTQLCDGVDTCGDNSDESSSLCSTGVAKTCVSFTTFIMFAFLFLMERCL